MKFLRIASIILLLFVGLNALIGGWLLILEPTGSKLHIPIELLNPTPFDDYLIPGIILFISIGLFSIATIILTLFKTKDYPWFIIFQGVIIIGWLSIEIILNKDFFSPILHYPLYAIAIILLLLGFYIRKKIIL